MIQNGRNAGQASGGDPVLRHEKRVGGAAHHVEQLVLAQLVGDGEQVDRLRHREEFLDGVENVLVGGYIEHLWLQEVENGAHSIVVNHERTKYGFFKFHGLWRDFAGDS